MVISQSFVKFSVVLHPYQIMSIFIILFKSTCSIHLYYSQSVLTQMKFCCILSILALIYIFLLIHLVQGIIDSSFVFSLQISFAQSCYSTSSCFCLLLEWFFFSFLSYFAIFWSSICLFCQFCCSFWLSCSIFHYFASCILQTLWQPNQHNLQGWQVLLLMRHFVF